MKDIVFSPVGRERKMTPLTIEEQLQIMREFVDNIESLLLNPKAPTGAKEMIRNSLIIPYVTCKVLLELADFSKFYPTRKRGL